MSYVELQDGQLLRKEFALSCDASLVAEFNDVVNGIKFDREQLDYFLEFKTA